LRGPEPKAMRSSTLPIIAQLTAMVPIILTMILIAVPLGAATAQCPRSPNWLVDAAKAIDRGDEAAAIRIVRPLAESGNPEAQDFMGRYYTHSLGPTLKVPKDEVEAAKWYHRAADQGDAFGFMHRDGEGVPQDYVLAYMWLTLAAQRRDPCLSHIAGEAADDVARKMSPAEIAEAQKLASEWKPGQEPSRPSSRGGESTADTANVDSILKNYAGDVLYERNCGALPPKLKNLMPVMEKIIDHAAADGLQSAGELIGQMQLTIEMIPGGKKEFCQNWSRDWSHSE
jgi:uncharacterized protein